MNAAAQAFTILTEFKFDVGHAVASSDTLTNAVDKISGSAERAQFAIARMSLSFAGSLFGGGGLVGGLIMASKVSDDFANGQISLANTLVATGMIFEDRMLAAKTVMEDLNTLAISNSLSFKELLNTTKLLTPMLLNKGLAGDNLSNVKDISRTFLKSAPTLGINPQEAMGQLLRTMEGQASMADTLFVRLAAETGPMKEFLNNTKKWNQLDPAKRVNILRKSLQLFANDADAVHARVMTLSGQMAQLRNNIEMLIRPIGAIINKFLAGILAGINSPMMMQKAKAIFEDIARGMDTAVSSPGKMFADLEQARALRGNLHTAGKGLLIMGIVEGLFHIFKIFKLNIPIVTSLVNIMAGAFGVLSASAIPAVMKILAWLSTGIMAVVGGVAAALTWLASNVTLAGIWFVANTIVSAVSSFLGPLIFFVLVLQLIARSLAYAKISALANVGEHMERIVKAATNLSNAFFILMSGLDPVARVLGSLLDPTQFFGFINLVSIFTWTLEFLSNTVGKVMMAFQGLVFFFGELINQVQSLISGNGFNGTATLDAANAGMLDMYEKIFGKIDKGEGGIVNQVVNMDVKMQNNFKEMLEPDRVAFTIRDQLLKANRNKTGASGRGMEAQQ